MLKQRLHQLIQALTANEKKYFSIELRKYFNKQESKLELLFKLFKQDNIPSQEEIEEAYLEQHFSVQYLSADLHKLYQSILDFAQSFKPTKNQQNQLHSDFQQILFLFQKKLFLQAQQGIPRLKKQLLKFEIYPLLLEVLQLEHRIAKILNHLDHALKALEEQQAIWKLQTQVNQIIALHYQSIQYRTQLAKARNTQDLERLEELVQNPLLTQQTAIPSFNYQFHLLETYANYYFIIDNKVKELQTNQKIIDLYHHFKHFMDDQPLNYLLIHTRVLAIRRSLYPKQFAEALQAYRQLKTKRQKKEAASIIFIFSYNYELDTYIKNQEWSKAKALLPTMQNGLKKYSSLISKDLIMSAYHRFALTYFSNQDYEQALHYLKKIQDDFTAKIRPDIYYFSSIFQLITHYELKNYRLIPYLTKTVTYQLKKHYTLYPIEKLLLNNLKKLAQPVTNYKRRKIFDNFSQKLNKLLQDNYAKNTLELFPIHDWILSKKN
ncbi:MAG: hypothetical protein MK212_17470 [Saprospiraceae bacterium]|nr:hypothetical protein [Saprospiraceae bacterium]